MASSVLPRWLTDPNYDPYWQQAPTIGDIRLAPNMGPQGMVPVDPMPVGETQILPRGAFHEAPMAPAPVGGLAGGASAAGAPQGPGWRERLSGGLARAGQMAGRAVDAYGSRQPDARMGYSSPRKAAFQRLGDLGPAMLAASGPRREPGSFGSRFGEALMGADAMGRSRRGEYRQETELTQRAAAIRAQQEIAQAKLASDKRAETPGIKDLHAFGKDYRASLKDFDTIQGSWARILSNTEDALTGSGIAQQAIIVMLNKVLDPSSVVRESEFGRAFSAQSFLDQVKAWKNKMESGEQLGPEAMRQVLETSKNIYEVARQEAMKREQEQAALFGRTGAPEGLRGFMVPDVLGSFRSDLYGGTGAGQYFGGRQPVDSATSDPRREKAAEALRKRGYEATEENIQAVLGE